MSPLVNKQEPIINSVQDPAHVERYNLVSAHLRKVAIIGVGLIGASLIKSLQRHEGVVGHVIGYGHGEESLIKAKAQGVIDEYTMSLADAVSDADLIVVATPIGAMAQIFADLHGLIKPSTIITDVGSVKQAVIKYAEQGLKEKIAQFIPAHPIAGVEHSGVDASFAQLYDSRYCIVTPLAQNSPSDVAVIKAMWLMAGSVLLDMSPKRHDEIFAATSHLPHMLVFGLMEYIANLKDCDDYLRVVAGGFLDYTRIASSDPKMWRDVCLSNKVEILDKIAGYQKAIDELSLMIEREDGDALFEMFSNAKGHRDELLVREKQRKQRD